MLSNEAICSIVTLSNIPEADLPSGVQIQHTYSKEDWQPRLMFKSPKGVDITVINHWNTNHYVTILLDSVGNKFKYDSLAAVPNPFRDFIESVILEYDTWKKGYEKDEEEKKVKALKEKEDEEARKLAEMIKNF